MNWKRTLLVVWLNQFLTQVGFAGVMPFIPLYFAQLLRSGDDRQVGIWVALFYFSSQLSFCLVMPIWGHLADGQGRKKILVLTNYCNTLVVPLMGLAPNALTLVLIRAFSSLFSGVIIIGQSLVSAQTPNDRQGFALGILSTADWGGLMLGYLLGGIVLDRFGFKAAFLLCGLTSAVAGLLVSLVREEGLRTRAKQSPIPFHQKLKNQLYLPAMDGFVVTALLFHIGLQFLRSFDSPYVPMLVKSAFGAVNVASNTGAINAAACLGGMFSGLLAGWLCDRVPLRLIIFPALIVTALATAAQPLATTVKWFSCYRFLQGLSAGCLVSALFTLISRHSRAEERSRVFALASSSSTAAMALGNLSSGAVVLLLGVPWVFYIPLPFYLLMLPIFRRPLREGGRPRSKSNRR